MSTQAQKEKYGHLGNEILYPLCLVDPPDKDAEAILKDRGNIITKPVVDADGVVIVPGGKLRKTRVKQYRDAHGGRHELIEVVENGKMVSRTVDGVSITGNIVQF